MGLILLGITSSRQVLKLATTHLSGLMILRFHQLCKSKLLNMHTLFADLANRQILSRRPSIGYSSYGKFRFSSLNCPKYIPCHASFQVLLFAAEEFCSEIYYRGRLTHILSGTKLPHAFKGNGKVPKLTRLTKISWTALDMDSRSDQQLICLPTKRAAYN